MEHKIKLLLLSSSDYKDNDSWKLNDGWNFEIVLMFSRQIDVSEKYFYPIRRVNLRL